MPKINYCEARLVNGKIVMGPVRQFDPSCCPHYIVEVDHYRKDGSCRCNDPKHAVMKLWGYKWSLKNKQWEADHA